MKKYIILIALFIGATSFSLDGKESATSWTQGSDGSAVIVIYHPDVIFTFLISYTETEETIYAVFADNRNVSGPQPVITAWSGTLQRFYSFNNAKETFNEDEPTFCFTGYVTTDLTGKVDINCNTL